MTKFPYSILERNYHSNYTGFDGHYGHLPQMDKCVKI